MTTLPVAAETRRKCLASWLTLCSTGPIGSRHFAPASEEPEIRVAKKVGLGPRAVEGGLSLVPEVPWWKMGPLLFSMGPAVGLG